MGLSIDREKVIKAYEECLCNNNHDFCSECYQDGPGFGIVCRNNVCRDALVLLKEQSAVKPDREHNGKPEPWTVWWHVCGSCGQPIDIIDRYCRRCGRAVDWS